MSYNIKKIPECYEMQLPLVRSLLSQRIKLVLRMLGNDHYSHILDVGTGSGILIPRLIGQADCVVGIDVHDKLDEVKEYLSAKIGSHQAYTKVHLERADVCHLPFPDEVFDAVVMVSVLDHLTDPKQALDEIKRVSVRGGTIVIGLHAETFPFYLFHCGLTIYSRLRGWLRNVREHIFEHVNTDTELIEMIAQTYTIEKIGKLPVDWLPRPLTAYTVVRSRNDK